MSLETSAPARRSSVRARLRDATGSAHEALHHAMPFRLIAEQSLDRSGYGALLRALVAFHDSMASNIGAACVELDLPALEHAARARRESLLDDLKVNDPGRATIAAPQIEQPGAAFAVGCLYTTLGSTLGGRVIYRQLDYLFADVEGRRFFAGSTDDSVHWQTFCRTLEAYGARADRLASIRAGAAFAFAHFSACLEGRS